MVDHVTVEQVHIIQLEIVLIYVIFHNLKGALWLLLRMGLMICDPRRKLKPHNFATWRIVS